MSYSLHLYDIRDRNYPNQRGDIFRSLQVFKCPLCDAVTNRVIMQGAHGYGVRAVCPNAGEGWHHLLEDKLKLQNPHHPGTYRAELQAEIDELKKTATVLAKNDILGEPDFSLISSVTNTRAYSPSSEDLRILRDIKERAKTWEASPKGKATRAAAEAAYHKSGNMVDFVAIMLGAKPRE